jgi:hypothetical protein
MAPTRVDEPATQKPDLKKIAPQPCALPTNKPGMVANPYNPDYVGRYR